MNTRKITIIQSRTQQKTVIETSAETLAELKAELTNRDIDFTDMSFFEGVSKTELLADSTPLPHDLQYKGTITNDLVIMLTNSRKKISSGSQTCEEITRPYTRKEMYHIIHENNLQEGIEETYGKNFTQCSNNELNHYIDDYFEDMEQDAEDSVTTPAYCEHTECNCKNVEKAFQALVDILYNSDVVMDEDREYINMLLNGDEGKSPYSNTEIDEMFANL